MPQSHQSPVCEVMILTALSLERKAVLDYLQEVEEAVHPEKDTIYWCGQFQGQQTPLASGRRRNRHRWDERRC